MKGQMNQAYILNQRLSQSLAYPKRDMKTNYRQQKIATQNMQIVVNQERIITREHLELSPAIVKLDRKIPKIQEPSLMSTGKFSEIRHLE
jgi:hypothetical protein